MIINIEKISQAPLTLNVGAVVGTAIADWGTAPYSYSISSGGDYFAVDSSTGVITTKVAMTAANIQQFTVLATDSSSAPDTAYSNPEYPNIQSPVQKFFSKPNVVYKITKFCDLKHGVLTIPAGCTLDFQGGVITSGTIIFNETVILKNTSYKLFDEVRFKGTLKGPVLNISEFGVKTDGATDDSYVIQDILDCIDGQGCELLMDCNNDYIIGGANNHVTIYVGSDTTWTFIGKGFLRLVSYSAIGSVVETKETATNVVMNNILIDGGGESAVAGGSGQNGLSIGNCGYVTVNGGIIRNCFKGDETQDYPSPGETYYGDGGKGVQVESHTVTSAFVSGLTIFNCHMALSCAREFLEAGNIKVAFSDIYAYNCGIFSIIHCTNGIPTVGNEQDVTIDNFVAENCGLYNNGEGVLQFSRASFFRISNGKIIGTNPVNSIIRGRFLNGAIDGVNIYQPCTNVINNDPSHYAIDASYKNTNDRVSIKVFAPYTYLFYCTSPTYIEQGFYESSADIFLSTTPTTEIAPVSWYNDGTVTGTLNLSTGDGKSYIGSFLGLRAVGSIMTYLNKGLNSDAFNIIDPSGLFTGGNIKTTTADTPELNVVGNIGDICITTSTNEPMLYRVYYKDSDSGFNYGWKPLTSFRIGTVSTRPVLAVGDAGFATYNNDYKAMEYWNGSKWTNSNGFTSITKKGTSLPTGLGTADEGTQFYYSAAKKWVFWNGTDWVNMDGTAL